MIKKILMFTLFACCIPFEISAEDASIEVSGSSSLYLSGNNGKNLTIASGLDIYLNKHYHIGPLFEYIYTKDNDDSEIGLAAGIMNGFVIPLNDIVAISAGFGAAYLFTKATFDIYFSFYSYGSDYFIRHAYTIPSYLGLKIKIAESAFIHVKPGYQYTQVIGTYKKYMHAFNAGIGFSIAIWNQNK